MKDSYQGALKSYLLVPVYALAGPSAASSRWTVVAFGAAGVAALALFVAELYGLAAGLWLGLAVALDPSLVVALYDQAPAMLGIGLRAAALLCFAYWGGGAGRLAWAFGGGLALGLGVWDKAHNLWFVAALAGASLLFRGLRLRERKVQLGASAAFGGFLVGAAPFIVFNFRFPLITFRDQGAMGWPLAEHLPKLAEWTAQRWDYLGFCLTGRGIYSMVTGELPPESIKTGHLALAGLGGALTAVTLARRDWKALEAAAFWLVTLALVFVAACLAPYPVKPHHFYVVYPLPQLALAALANALFERLRKKRLPAAAFAALMLSPLVFHASALRAFAAKLDQNGGSHQFYRGLDELAAWLDAESRARPGLSIYDDGIFRSSLTVLMKEPLRVEYSGREAAMRRACPKAVPAREVLILQRNAEELGWMPGTGYPSPFAFSEKPYKTILYSDGSSWARIYRRFLCGEDAR